MIELFANFETSFLLPFLPLLCTLNCPKIDELRELSWPRLIDKNRQLVPNYPKRVFRPRDPAAP